MHCNKRFSSSHVFIAFLHSKGDCAEPCQHGGTCVQGQCICPLNYEGEHCENGMLFQFLDFAKSDIFRLNSDRGGEEGGEPTKIAA